MEFCMVPNRISKNKEKNEKELLNINHYDDYLTLLD